MFLIGLIKNNQFLADIDDITFMLIKFISLLSLESNQILLKHHLKFINPLYSQWLSNLQKFVYYFIQLALYPPIRILAIENLQHIFDIYGLLQCELFIKSIFPQCNEILDRETNEQVRNKLIYFLGEMFQKSSCTSSNLLLDQLYIRSKITHYNLPCIEIIIESFHKKWTQIQSKQTIKIFHILIDILNHCEINQGRKLILQCLLQIKLQKDEKLYLNKKPTSFIKLLSSSTQQIQNYKSISYLNYQFIINCLLNGIFNETSFINFEICLNGIIDILQNNYFALKSCDLQIIAQNIYFELKENKFSSSIQNNNNDNENNHSFVNNDCLFLKAFHILGFLLISYRKFLSVDFCFQLFDFLFQSLYDEVLKSKANIRIQIQNKLLQILGACCIDFSEGYLKNIQNDNLFSSKFISILQEINNQQQQQQQQTEEIEIINDINNTSNYLSGFLCCFITSSCVKIFSNFSKKEKKNLLIILSSITKISKTELISNNYFRLLILLFQNIKLSKRKKFYKIILQNLIQSKNQNFKFIQSSICLGNFHLLTNANIDLLSRYLSSDIIIDHSPLEYDDNTFFFSSNLKCNYYLLGNIILSIQIGNMNWIKTKIYRSSGTTTWILQIQQNPTSNNKKIHFPNDILSYLLNKIQNLPKEKENTSEISNPSSSSPEINQNKQNKQNKNEKTLENEDEEDIFLFDSQNNESTNDNITNNHLNSTTSSFKSLSNLTKTTTAKIEKQPLQTNENIKKNQVSEFTTFDNENLSFDQAFGDDEYSSPSHLSNLSSTSLSKSNEDFSSPNELTLKVKNKNNHLPIGSSKNSNINHSITFHFSTNTFPSPDESISSSSFKFISSNAVDIVNQSAIFPF